MKINFSKKDADKLAQFPSTSDVVRARNISRSHMEKIVDAYVVPLLQRAGCDVAVEKTRTGRVLIIDIPKG